uniref:Uncharacterized protein n=1 Tax=Trieres chinensis TaxID=1514140 RepID=A0A7S2A4Y5_TRICV|mmetsp:Transcript_39667/g.80949  ORF Transcript_39667/g.80949 Transcript_39667/m.80949 type:complete len:303 (+) Transcript_39667:53-961(+)
MSAPHLVDDEDYGVLIVPPGPEPETGGPDDLNERTFGSLGGEGGPPVATCVVEGPDNGGFGVPSVIEYEPTRQDDSPSFTPTMVERAFGGAENDCDLRRPSPSLVEVGQDVGSRPPSSGGIPIDRLQTGEKPGVSGISSSFLNALSLLAIVVFSFLLGIYCSKRELEQFRELRLAEAMELHMKESENIKHQLIKKNEEYTLHLEELKTKLFEAESKHVELERVLHLRLLEAKKTRLEEANKNQELRKDAQEKFAEKEIDFILKLQEIEENNFWWDLVSSGAGAAAGQAARVAAEHAFGFNVK